MNSFSDDDIVISGISGRFPQSSNVEEFSQNLFNKIDMTEDYEIGVMNFRSDALPKRCGKLRNLEKFDASFFSIMNKLADAMDPQMRAILEHAYECILDAGLSPQMLRGSNTGVIVAMSQSDSKDALIVGAEMFKSGFKILGKSGFFIPNRISFALGLHGPSFVVDSACCSTSTALDCAYQFIRSGQCDAIIVGACQFCIDYNLFNEFGSLDTLTLNDLSRPFDEKASGFVRSSAIGTILLQKRKDAKRVYANVVYSMSNQDGYKPEGQTLPSMKLQTQLMENFYKKIDIDPCDIDFFEAHATGTFLGDYQEASAIDKVFCKDKNRGNKLTIGSVKSNMGHAEPAAGFASIAKIIVAFESKKFPPNINLNKLRQDVEAFKENRMIVATDAVELTSEYIAMNSFNLGGTNVHTLFKQNAKEKINFGLPSDDLERVVLWSGRTQDAVSSIFDAIEKRSLDAEYIALLQNSQIKTPDANSYRGYGIFKSEDTAKCIKRDIQEFDGLRRPIVFVYSGMGTQWHKMGCDLMKIPLFAASIEKCHEILLTKGVDLKAIINSSDENIYDNILNSYLGIISIEIAFTDVLKSLDVEADFIIGHSFGEISCSYADGCLTLEEALSVALIRAQITIESNITNGAMAAIGLHFSEVEKILPEDIDIACHNSAQSTTISGQKFKVLKFIESLKAQKIFAKEVPCAGIPFHSRYIKDVGAKLHESLLKILTNTKTRSTKWITSTYAQDNDANRLCDAKYHVDNLMNPVMFENVMERLPKNAIVVEISPHGFLQSILKSSLVNSVYVDFAKKSSKDGKFYFLEALGRLFESGIDMNIAALYPSIDYPVSRATPMISPLIKWNHSENYPFDYVHLKFRNEHLKKIININEKKYEFLKDHIVDGRGVIPGAFWIVTVWESLGWMLGVRYDQLKVTFRDVEFLRTTKITPNKDIIILVTILRDSGRFEIIESDAIVASGIIQQDDNVKISKFKVLDNSNAVYLNKEDFYKHANILGYTFLEEFRKIHEIRSDGLHARVKPTDNWTTAIDAVFQMGIAAIHQGLYVGRKIGRLSIDPILNRQMSKENEFLEFNCSREMELGICGGIEIERFTSLPIGRHLEKKPVFESYKFIPFECDVKYSQIDAFKILIQTFIDGNSKLTYEVVEINESEDFACEILSKINKQIAMDFNLTLLTSKLIEIDNVEVIDSNIKSLEKVDVVIKNNSVNDDDFIAIIKTLLNDNGVLITQEDSNVEINDKNLVIVSRVNLDSRKVLWMLKLRPQNEIINYKIFELTQNLDWIEPLKNSLITDDSVLIYSQSVDEFSGIVGFFKCLKKEMSSKSLKCFLIQDENAPKFNINHPFYAKQLAKGHSINVLKNGQWGSYYHLDINPDNQLKPQTGHCFVNYLRKGDISSLKWLQGPLDVNNFDPLVRIQYASLIFKDVIFALGYIQDSVNLKKECSIGIEFSGVCVDTGERVMGTTRGQAGCLSTGYAEKNAFLFKLPPEMSLDEGATIVYVYSTVYYSFFMISKIEAGKSVLIHSGAGGVGQAALHTAFAYGLEVFTTVGTEDKQKFLLETFPQLKPENIGNSRDTSFKQMIMENTNGKGVDFVLNSLSGDKLIASFDCLKHKGVFLEIGRADVEMGKRINMQYFSKEISFKIIRVDELDIVDLTKLIDLVNRDIDAGIIKPITRTIFEASEVENAFRYMMTGNHIGKILLKIRENENDVETIPFNAIPRFYCNEDHSYIVIGGLGGLGLQLCQWLAGRKCTKLVISSSRGLNNQYQAYKLNYLKSFDVEIVISTDDITTEDGCKELLKKALKLGPIGGIFNLAAILQDAIFENQTIKMFQKSLAPKAIATKHLHELSLKYCPELKHFIVFSSVTSGRGNAGQTNYGMGNSIMEEIIEMRSQMNLPAKAIQWGPIKDVGMLADIQLESIGQFTLISLSSFLDSLDTLLLHPDLIVSCTGALQNISKDLSSKNFIQILMNLLHIEDRKTINLHSTLSQFGIDSLTGVELQQIIQRDFNVSLTSNELRSLTINELEMKIHGEDKNEAAKVSAIEYIIDELEVEDIVQFLTPTSMIRKMNAMESSDKKILIIPGVLGVIDEKAYQVLASNIICEVYGLQYSNIFLNNDDIQSFNDFMNYLNPHVLEFYANCKTFVLIGHSHGVLITMKLAKYLEDNLGISGCLIAIDGSPEINKQIEHYVAKNSYNARIDEGMIAEVNKYLKELKSKEDVEDYVMKSLTTRLKMATSIDESDFPVLNKTKIILLKTFNSLVRMITENYGMSKYSKLPVDLHHLAEGHHSILTASETHKIINEFIELY